MTAGKKDGFAFLKDIFDNKAVRAGLAIASIALFLRHKDFVDDDRLHEHMARKQAYRDYVKFDHERSSRKTRYYNDYFSQGEGWTLLRERAYVQVEPQAPFPDAVYSTETAGFRQAAFSVTSASANATVRVGWDVADRNGGISLQMANGTKWSLGIYAMAPGLSQYAPGKEIDVESATLACRLLATPGSPFKTITLTRPNFTEIKAAIWHEHMLTNPELAADFGWWPTKEEERAHRKAEYIEMTR